MTKDEVIVKRYKILSFVPLLGACSLALVCGAVWNAVSISTGEPHLQHRIAQVVEPNEVEDGCGLTDTRVRPQWINYAGREAAQYAKIHDCYNRIKVHRPIKQVEPSPRSKLSCPAHDEIDFTNIKEIHNVIANHDRILFIGDSVLRQVFATAVCMVDPDTQAEDIEGRGEGGYSNTNGNLSFEWKHDADDLMMEDFKDVKEEDSKVTKIEYVQFGYKFDRDQKALYRDEFVQAIAESGKRDAIIINAGLHYHHNEAMILYDAVSFIANKAPETNGTVYFMETADEQWPTSNGIFTPACDVDKYCTCEALTNERLIGRGKVGMNDKWDGNLTADLELHKQAQTNETLKQFFSEVIYNEKRLKRINSKRHEARMTYTDNILSYYDFNNMRPTVPSYLPANWRNDIAHAVFVANYTSNCHDEVKVVPIWNQLVLQGLVHARSPKDCTHKSMNVMIAITEQLIRTIRGETTSYRSKFHNLFRKYI